METSDSFTFCQNSLQSNSFAAFAKMREKGQFCDLVIKVQNRSIKAHWNIVAAAIPYFQSLERTDENISLNENDLHPDAVESLILFAYTSEVGITEKNVQSLLVAAQFLELDEVRDSCTKFISNGLNIQNVGYRLKMAVVHNISRLIENISDYIVMNFEDFSKTRHFLHLSPAFLKKILAADDLVVSSEEVVFEAVTEWVKFSPSDRDTELLKLLTEVRMNYLPISYLKEKVKTQEFIKNSESCRDLVNAVECCHRLSDSAPEFVNFKTPRKCLMFSLCAFCVGCLDADSGSHNKKLSVLSLVNNKWVVSASTDLSGSVLNFSGAQGKIYIFFDEIVAIFNPGNNEWKHLKLANKRTKGAAMVFHEGKIYSFGSEHHFSRKKSEFFDTKSNKWSEAREMKTVRLDAAAASLGKFIYVTGGYSKECGINTVEKYSPSRDQWTDVAGMCTPRHKHGCISMNGKIYVCGGMDSKALISDIAEVYDPGTNSWTIISPTQSIKTVISLTAHCGRMYAFGYEGIEVYEPETEEWKSCSSVPPGFVLVGAVSISNSSIQNVPHGGRKEKDREMYEPESKKRKS